MAKNCAEKVKAFGQSERQCCCCCVKTKQGNGSDLSQIFLFHFGLLDLSDAFFSLPENKVNEITRLFERISKDSYLKLFQSGFFFFSYFKLLEIEDFC